MRVHGGEVIAVTDGKERRTAIKCREIGPEIEAELGLKSEPQGLGSGSARGLRRPVAFRNRTRQAGAVPPFS